jgi:hypothetical protein
MQRTMEADDVVSLRLVLDGEEVWRTPLSLSASNEGSVRIPGGTILLASPQPALRCVIEAWPAGDEVSLSGFELAPPLPQP